MKHTILIIALVLAGCGGTIPQVKPEAVTVVSTKYIVKIPPAELLTIPAKVPNIDVDTAKQSDIAKWMIAGEERTRALENLITGIASFFKTEQSKADDLAAQQNQEALKKASELQGNSATEAIKKQ